MEGVYRTQRAAPITIGGIPSDSEHRVLYGIELPGLLSWLAAFDINAEVRGLDSFPPGDRPNPILVHAAFDTMTGLGVLLGLLGMAFSALALWRRRVPVHRPLLAGLVVAGPAAVVAMEAGWFVTEFGRQPWIVYGVLRTSEAVTSAPGLGPAFAAFTVVYAGLALTTARLLLRLAERGRIAR
jgi:cytochrome d ubiquinol oxidase subunit I